MPLFRKMKTASALPARVVAVEDQSRSLEEHVSARLDEVRHELAEIRRLLEGLSAAETEAVELTGRLLRSAEARLDALEERASSSPAAPREVSPA